MDEKVHPDVRTYTVLLRGCLTACRVQEIANLLRSAFGLQGARFKPDAARLRAGWLPPDLISQVLEGIAHQCHQDLIAMELLSDLRRIPKLQLDPKLSMRL